MSSRQISWEADDFKDIKKLYALFEKIGYNLGDQNKMDPKLVPGLKKVNISKHIKGLYQVVYQEMEIQIWLIYAPNKASQKTWRNLINKEVMESYGDYVLFFKKDSSQYWISIIADDILEEIVFKPESPSPKSDRFIKDLLSKRPLIDPKGLTASILQAKHELTAKKLSATILKGEEFNTFLLFKRAGLYIGGDLDLIAPRRDAPLKDTIIKVLVSTEYNENWISNNLMHLVGEYHNSTKNNLRNIILIFKDSICYYSAKGQLYEKFPYSQKEVKMLISRLISIVACFDVKAAFNSETFEQQFGEFSPFFIKASYVFKTYLRDFKDEIEFIRKEWERFFGKVYQTKDIDEELFVKHTYLSLIIKIVLFCKYLPEKLVDDSTSFVELADYFEKRGIELFINDFYAWVNRIEMIRENLYDALKNAEYESEDIFRKIYQDMVSPATRHALGEFYTPPGLASLMVDHAYKFGMETLDPACGSGTFLIEIITSIKKSGKSLEDQYKAISKIYGFDINPIAVLVSKANILLHLEEYPNTNLPVNIFLVDSVFPIKRISQSSIDWGLCESFPLGDEGELIINEKFFYTPNSEDSYNYLKDFISILQFIDELMVANDEAKILIAKFNSKFNNSWLDEEIIMKSYNSEKTYRDNIINIINELAGLHKKKKNHIWLYLLYNSIGTKLVRNKMELVIGNPPWIGLNNIYSSEYQDLIKKFAKKYNIGPSKSANISNLEFSSIFIYQCTDLYLKKNGKIKFLVPRAVNKGSHNDCLRQFKNLYNLELWDFEKPRPFTEEFVVFTANKKIIGFENLSQITKRLKMKYRDYQPKLEGGWSFNIIEEKSSDNWVPANIELISKGVGKKKVSFFSVGRFISPEIKVLLPPFKKSDYHSLFYNGAVVTPRNLLFIKRDGDSYIFDDQQLKSAKRQWKYKAFDRITPSKSNVYGIIKSDALVPYHIFKRYEAFLPIKVENGNFVFDNDLKGKDKEHWEFIEREFEKKRKKKKNEEPGKHIITLWDQINYLNKLINPMQAKPLKLIYNASSRIHLKAAIIRGEYIIDTTCYYYGLTDEAEAYYLLAIFNSSLLTFALIEIKSERHIHKHPFDFPIPLWDPKNGLHQEINKKGKLLEKKVNKFVEEWINDEINKENKKRANSRKVQSKLNPSIEKDRHIVIKSGQSLEKALYNHIEEDLNILDPLISRLLHEE